MSTARGVSFTKVLVGLALLAWPGRVLGTMDVQSQGGVSFVSGGVGDEERQALQAMSKRFDLKLTMALTDGTFISDVGVRILDAHGKAVLDTTSNGPLLYAQLAPGTYTVKCVLNGKQIERAVRIGTDTQQHLVFTWAAE